jgi:hypothetical protein
MGYVAPVNALDLSNANTAAVVDPTNPVGVSAYRAVATVDRFGHFTFTETTAYSGNNGRAAILNSAGNVFYTAGNAGNGGNPQPDGVILGAGAQILTPASVGEYQQNPGTPTPVGSFSIVQLGVKADKIGKDDNFRGIGIYKNVVYFTKGSGNGSVNTICFVDTTGAACPNGVGIPALAHRSPVSPLSLAGVVQNSLPGSVASAAFPAPRRDPRRSSFGPWFANADTSTWPRRRGFAGDSTLYTRPPRIRRIQWIFNATTSLSLTCTQTDLNSAPTKSPATPRAIMPPPTFHGRATTAFGHHRQRRQQRQSRHLRHPPPSAATEPGRGPQRLVAVCATIH